MMKDHCASQVFQETTPILPEGKRVPFSTGFFGLSSDGTPVRIFFSKPHSHTGGSDHPGPARLRLTCAMDVREERSVEVCINGDPTPIGVLDIRFAYIQQPFDLEICGDIAREVLENGVRVRMTKGKEDTFFFFNQKDSCLCPTLIFDNNYPDRQRAFRDRLFSTASIQPFGWMEGCVLDGLSSMAEQGEKRALSTIRQHLGMFVVNGSLVYEDPRGNICDDRIYGIEAGLPFSLMALHRIGADSLKLFQRFVESVPVDAPITDTEFISAEGNYTIAYPLALIGRLQDDPKLLERAVTQLLVRKQALRDGKGLYLRNDKGTRSYRNWGRAFVWYLLGLEHVLRQMQLGGHSYPQELAMELQDVVETAVSCLDQGLCHVFLGESETGIETSGTAGIGAALTLGIRFGLLEEQLYGKYIMEIRSALLGYLTPDGMLGGVSQSNRGGERLQRNGYRVISQMGMGLMAHFM